LLERDLSGRSEVGPIYDVAGTLVGVVAFTVHERQHRQAWDAYRPEAADRAAIVVQRADVA